MCIPVRLKSLFGFFVLGMFMFPGNVVTGQSFSVIDSSHNTVELSFSTTQTGVLIAFSDDETFGSPADGATYSADQDLGDNTTVISVGDVSPFTHDNLSPGTYYYYRAWYYDDSYNYTLIGDANARTLKYEPSYHVTSFSGSPNGDTELSLTWTDAAGSVLPDGYLIKGSTVSYDDIAAPSDGTEEADNALVKNVEYGAGSVAFSGLDANTTHYFRIWPYTNQGTHIDYKLHTGTLPKTTVKTEKSSQSDIVEQAGFVYITDIPYASHTGSVSNGSPRLWAITIRDGGDGNDADNLSTTLTDLTLNISNYAFLNEIGLYESDGTTPIATASVASSQVTFSGLSIEALDDNSVDVIIRATFSTTVDDNEQISFSITDGDVTADPAGSTFGTFSLSSKTDGGKNTINVTATKLHISHVDNPVDVNSDFKLTVEAVDGNDNLDKDAADQVTLSLTTGSGILSSTTGLAQPLSLGTYQWTDLQYDTEETFAIEAAAAGLTNASTGNISVNASSDSEVEAPSTQIGVTTIASTANDIGNAVQVFAFKITDKGTGGGLPTKVTNIRLKPATGNNISWADHIQNVVVYTTDTVTTGTVNITDNNIDIPISSGNLDVTDGSSKEVTISVYLNTTNIIDNGSLQMKVDNDPHGFTADASGSGFASAFTAEVVSNTHTIDVDATELAFIQQPTEVYTGYVMDPPVTVEAIDANGNRDLDYNNDITLTPDKSSITGTATETASSGLATFDNVIFDTEATGVTLTASNGSLADASSQLFDIILSEPQIEITHDGSPLDPADGTTDLGFGDVEWGASSTITLTIKNTGKADLEITGITDDGDFTASGLTPTVTLIPDASTNFDITFSPTSQGPITGTINVANNDTDPFYINVEGQGIYNSQSDIIADGGFTYPENIEYVDYMASNITDANYNSDAIQVGRFTIRDGGASNDADDQSTVLQDITFSVSNHANINRIAIVDGSTVKAEAAAAADVSFSSLGLEALDNGEKNFDIYVSFDNTVTDNEQVQLSITSVTAGTGSDFATADGGGAETSVTGDDNRINVTATKLTISHVDNPVDVNTDFALTVEALDGNDNLDTDATDGVTLDLNTGSGTLSSGTNLTQNLSSGTYQWTDLQYDTEETFAIEAVASGLTNASSGDISVNPSSDSEVGEPTTQISTQTIASTANDIGDAVEVFAFDITDNGAGGGLPTKVTNIRLKPATGNDISWADHIQNVVVSTTSTVTTGTVDITNSYIDIPISSGNLDVTDGSSKEVTISVYLNTTNITDNGSLQMKVDDDPHGFTADASGSGFASTFTAEVVSNTHTIDVTATTLAFIQQPTNVYTNYTMDPSVTVAATDANGNRDLDYTTDLTIKVHATGSADGEEFTVIPVAGLATFDAISFNDGDAENDVHFKAESGSLTSSVDSDNFNIILSVPEIKVTHNSIEVAHDGTVTFSAIEAGTTTTKDIVIHNTGKADLEVSGLNVTGGSTGGFSLVNPPTTSFTIIPDGDQTITVEFAPDAADSFLEALEITHDDGVATSPYHVNLSGDGDPNNESDIVEQDGFVYPTDIQHVDYQSGDIITDELATDAIEVGQFILRDGGDGDDADGLSTILDEIVFHVSNDQYLRQVALVVDGSVVVSTAAGSSVTFTGSGLVTAPDNGSKTFSLYVSFMENVTDNEQFQFTITGVTAGSNGSNFAASDGGGASTSVDVGKNRIDVTATQMAFESVPSTVTLGSPFTIQVKPVDGHGNVDLDEDRSVDISLESGTGALYTAAASKAFDNGIAQWDDLEYNVAEMFKVKVTDPASSGAFSEIITGDIDGQMPSSPDAPSVTIQYIADDQMSIQVTKPSGTFGTDWDGYVVFAREGSSNDAVVDNTDLDDFTADANYGDGTPNNNSYCVAKVTTDANATITVTGLTLGNDYYFVAYAANQINGNDNDLWSVASSQVSDKADVQGVYWQGAYPGNTKVTVQWNNYTATPGDWWDEVMVVGREGDVVDYNAPSGDGSAYTANAVFKSGDQVGEGYVVYRGIGESVTVSGLDNGTAYHFRIFVRRGTQWTDASHYEDVSATPTGGEGQLVITEVAAYHEDDTKNYIELYNAGDEDVNLNGWVLDQEGVNVNSITLSEDNQHNTSANMLLRPGEYALIVKSNWDGLKSEFGIAGDVPMFTASGGNIPSLAGGEYYVFYPPGAKSTTDEFGSGATFQAEDGVCYERNYIPNSDGTLLESWNEVSSTSYTYTPASDNTNPLPVELVVFRLDRDKDAVNIQWVTASEVNNSHFDLQRSVDGVAFLTVTTVAGAGNSNELIDYHFTDYPGHNGVVYYRLKQYDYDGTSTAGPVKAVDMRTAAPQMTLSAPWVNRQKVNTRVEHVATGEKLVVQLFNMQGRLVTSREVRAQGTSFTLQVDMNGNPHGIYIIRVVSRDHRVSKRFYF